MTDQEISEGIANEMFDHCIMAMLEEVKMPYIYGDNSFAFDVKRSDGREVRIIVSTFNPQNV